MKTTYCIGTESGQTFRVLKRIQLFDPKAYKEAEGNPTRIWVNTSLSIMQLVSIHGVEDAIEAAYQATLPDGTVTKKELEDALAVLTGYLEAHMDELPANVPHLSWVVTARKTLNRCNEERRLARESTAHTTM